MKGNGLNISETPCEEQSLELSAVNGRTPLWEGSDGRFVTPRVCQDT